MSNNQKTYAVYFLSDAGNSPAKIAKELLLTNKEVKEILSVRKKNNNEKIKTTSAPVNSKNLMITETSVKGTKNVAIMTKAASELNDSYRKKINETVSRTSKGAIYRPNNKS